MRILISQIQKCISNLNSLKKEGIPVYPWYTQYSQYKYTQKYIRIDMYIQEYIYIYNIYAYVHTKKYKFVYLQKHIYLECVSMGNVYDGHNNQTPAFPPILLVPRHRCPKTWH